MEWIDTEDQIPDTDVEVLAYDGDRIYIAFRPPRDGYSEHWCICEEGCCSCDGCTGPITHWMPLPESPEE